MPKIIVLNLGTDHALSEDPAHSQPLAKSVWRHAWFCNPGDIIVTPVSFEADFLNYVGETLGFNGIEIAVLNRHVLLSDEQLLAQDLVRDLQERLADVPGWSIDPCFQTPGTVALAERLRLHITDGMHFAAQRGCDLVNRKTHFRQLAAGARIPIPRGSVVHNPKNLAETIQRLLPLTGTVIVKRDNGAGGQGNITLTTGPVAAMAGSRDTRDANSDIETLAVKVWGELTDRLNSTVVVESYHRAQERFYFEYLIDEHGQPHFLNSGTVRTRPDFDPLSRELVWIGLDIPAEIPSLTTRIISAT